MHPALMYSQCKHSGEGSVTVTAFQRGRRRECWESNLNISWQVTIASHVRPSTTHLKVSCASPLHIPLACRDSMLGVPEDVIFSEPTKRIGASLPAKKMLLTDLDNRVHDGVLAEEHVWCKPIFHPSISCDSPELSHYQTSETALGFIRETYSG